MARELTLTLRVDAEERAMVERLAQRWQRTRSDVVRLLVRTALQEMGPADQEPMRRTGSVEAPPWSGGSRVSESTQQALPGGRTFGGGPHPAATESTQKGSKP